MRASPAIDEGASLAKVPFWSGDPAHPADAPSWPRYGAVGPVSISFVLPCDGGKVLVEMTICYREVLVMST